MARYSLIIKDVTYAKLLTLAAKEGLTLGKFLNKILDEYVEMMESEET